MEANNNAGNQENPVTIGINDNYSRSRTIGALEISISNCRTQLLEPFKIQGVEKPHYRRRSRTLIVAIERKLRDRTFVCIGNVYVGEQREKYETEEMVNGIKAHLEKAFEKTKLDYIKSSYHEED